MNNIIPEVPSNGIPRLALVTMEPTVFEALVVFSNRCFRKPLLLVKDAFLQLRFALSNVGASPLILDTVGFILFLNFILS